jgi:hypothetical protein
MRSAPLLFPFIFTLAGLPKTLEPLHYQRAGFRAAGYWLAEHTLPTDPITDPLCWSHYYAGRVFLEHTIVPVPKDHQTTEYIVVEKSDNAHPRVKAHREALEKVRDLHPVFTWSGKRGRKHAEVLIYAVPVTSHS